jgi:hypothetical protein
MVLPSPKQSPLPSPTNSREPRSPSGNRSYLTCWNEHSRAFNERNAIEIKRQYSEEYCKLVYTDMALGSVAVFEGAEKIGAQMEHLFEEFKGDYEIAKVEKTQPDAEHVSEGIVFCYWTTEQGHVSGADTICIVGGRIVLHTLVVSRKIESEEVIAAETASHATAEFEDAAASNRAEAGDIPSQEAASEPQDIVSSQGISDDEFIEVGRAPVSSYDGSEEMAAQDIDEDQAPVEEALAEEQEQVKDGHDQGAEEQQQHNEEEDHDPKEAEAGGQQE